MAETHRQNLTRKQLEEGRIPNNYVLLEMMHSSEGIKSKGGIIVGVLLDEDYDDETTTHAADLTEVYGKVYKLPEKLTYAENGMQWDCDMDLQVSDIVFFNVIESKNAVEIVCEDKLYKLIPYQDCYCAKRLGKIWRGYGGATGEDVVVMLNGYVLCKPTYVQTDSPLAVEDKKEDKTRGIIRFVGKPNRSYLNPNYVDFVDLHIGDLVLFNPNTPLFPLERKSALAQFDGNNLYNVVQRRRIAMVLSKNN